MMSTEPCVLATVLARSLTVTGLCLQCLDIIRAALRGGPPHTGTAAVMGIVGCIKGEGDTDENGEYLELQHPLLDALRVC